MFNLLLSFLLSHLFESELGKSSLFGKLSLGYGFCFVIGNFFLHSLNLFNIRIVNDPGDAVFLFDLCKFSIESIPLQVVLAILDTSVAPKLLD